DGIKGALTDYAMSIRVFNSTTKKLVTLVQIVDGTSNTICTGEKSLRWDRYNSGTGDAWDDCALRSWGGSLRNGPTIQQDSNGITADDQWGAPFTGGCPFVMYDGSVRMIPFGTDA